VTTMDPAVDIALRSGLSLLLLVAAGHKLRDVAHFRSTLADYRLMPESMVAAAGALVIAIEIAVAVALVTLRTAGTVAAASLLTSYAAAIGVNLVRGRRHIDCGCAGPALRQPISGWLVARNAALVGTALVGMAPLDARPLVWVDGFTVVGTTLMLAAVYAAVDGLIANAPGFARVRGVA
jgi:hypothetical protein